MWNRELCLSRRAESTSVPEKQDKIDLSNQQALSVSVGQVDSDAGVEEECCFVRGYN